jgi:hypothetical protein
MVYLQVTFTLEAQNVASFKEYYEKEFLPVILSHGFEAVGVFETLVGDAGEMTEIWRFADMSDYERKWRSLMSDPELPRIFETTGPMVKNERFKLMESVAYLPAP